MIKAQISTTLDVITAKLATVKGLAGREEEEEFWKTTLKRGKDVDGEINTVYLKATDLLRMCDTAYGKSRSSQAKAREAARNTRKNAKRSTKRRSTSTINKFTGANARAVDPNAGTITKFVRKRDSVAANMEPMQLISCRQYKTMYF